jgi:IS30 family transposase
LKKYSRVSYEVRCQIYALIQVKTPIPEIASVLGFNKSTIYRELKRNWTDGKEAPRFADFKAKKRYRESRIPRSTTLFVSEYIRAKLLEDWSPEQIAGRLWREHKYKISHQTIYNYVRNYEPELKKRLRRHGKRGAGRYRTRNRLRSRSGLSIRNRPEIANQRRRIGDWERDTMHTLDGVQLLVCSDRKSRLTKISVLKDRSGIEVGKETLKLINSTGKKLFTVTNDNGGDFRGNVDIGVRTYFCDPHKPQQRGTVENTIGLLRQYVKRKTDMTKTSNYLIHKLEEKINLRPRKVLDYKTPYEVYFNEKVALGVLI